MIENKGLRRNGNNDAPVPFIPQPLLIHIALHCTSKSAMVRANFAFFGHTSFLSPTHPSGLSSYLYKYPDIKVFDTRIALLYQLPFLLLLIGIVYFLLSCPARSPFALVNFPSREQPTHPSQNSASPIPSTTRNFTICRKHYQPSTNNHKKNNFLSQGRVGDAQGWAGNVARARPDLSLPLFSVVVVVFLNL